MKKEEGPGLTKFLVGGKEMPRAEFVSILADLWLDALPKEDRKVDMWRGCGVNGWVRLFDFCDDSECRQCTFCRKQLKDIESKYEELD